MPAAGRPSPAPALGHVGDHDRDGRLEPAIAHGVDQRLQIRAAARDEHAEPPASGAAVRHRRRPALRPRPGRCRRPARPLLRAAARQRRIGLRHRHHHADAHVEGAVLIVGGTSPARPSHSKIGGTGHEPCRTSAAVPSGSMRGRLSVRPPPVMCAMPFTGRPPAAAAARAGTTDAAAAAPRPRCRPARERGCRRRGRACRRRCGAPASSRWCAGPTDGTPSSTSPGTDRRGRRRAVARSTAPTMKPARSYSPSA